MNKQIKSNQSTEQAAKEAAISDMKKQGEDITVFQQYAIMKSLGVATPKLITDRCHSIQK